MVSAGRDAGPDESNLKISPKKLLKKSFSLVKIGEAPSVEQTGNKKDVFRQ